MTNSPSDNPKNRKYSQKLFKYIGPQENLRGLWFVKLAANEEDWLEKDGWKFDLEPDTEFAITIQENHLQPPPLQNLFCKFDYKQGNDDPFVDNSGNGGYIWMGTKDEFKTHFKQTSK